MKMPDTLDELDISKQDGVILVRFRNRKIIDELQIQRIGERLQELALAERPPKWCWTLRRWSICPAGLSAN